MKDARRATKHAGRANYLTLRTSIKSANTWHTTPYKNKKCLNGEKTYPSSIKHDPSNT
jgi:hypothetical protein